MQWAPGSSSFYGAFVQSCDTRLSVHMIANVPVRVADVDAALDEQKYGVLVAGA